MNHEQQIRSVAGRPITSSGAFTLIELLASLAILGLIIVVLFSAFEQVNKAWLMGENRVETSADGRAILDLMSRELSQAMATNNLTFYGDATNVYFVAPVNSDPNNLADLCGVGYAFERNDSTSWTMKLVRHLIQPTSANVAGNWIHDPTWWKSATLNDTPATVASNSILFLNFLYYDNTGNPPTTTWLNPNKLPTAISIEISNVDSRTSARMRLFPPPPLPPSTPLSGPVTNVINSTVRDFYTKVYLPNSLP